MKPDQGRRDFARMMMPSVAKTNTPRDKFKVNIALSPAGLQARGSVLNEVVAPQHWAALQEASGKGYTFNIRETGAASIVRIEQGAKPKPHTILEKSIKDSSIKKGYPDTFEQTKEKMQHLDLEGFVGHWDKEGKLLGVRIDNCAPKFKQLCQTTTDPNGKQISYLPVDLEQEGGGEELKALRNLDKEHWQKELYTGDYDLHELYHGNALIQEGSHEKAAALSMLNAAIVRGNDTDRPGKFKSTNGQIHLEEGGEYAMFQHGDQATYIANQHLEAGEKGEKFAQLVPQVAQEDNGVIATFHQGEVFVTNNRKELQELRADLGMNGPTNWNEKRYSLDANSERRTSGYGQKSTIKTGVGKFKDSALAKMTESTIKKETKGGLAWTIPSGEAPKGKKKDLGKTSEGKRKRQEEKEPKKKGIRRLF